MRLRSFYEESRDGGEASGSLFESHGAFQDWNSILGGVFQAIVWDLKTGGLERSLGQQSYLPLFPNPNARFSFMSHQFGSRVLTPPIWPATSPKLLLLIVTTCSDSHLYSITTIRARTFHHQISRTYQNPLGVEKSLQYRVVV